MTAWKVAQSLDVLLAQINEAAPHRSKASDGSIGDAAHASRDSDHNPWLVLSGQPLVTARDFTNDPDGGLPGQRLADALRASRDPRIKYVIWNRQIMAGAGGPEPWVWRPYRGTNPHQHHVHVSVVADRRCQSSTPWSLPGFGGSGGGAAEPSPGGRPTIRRGDTGPAVQLIQRFLGVVTAGGPGYGVFGPATEEAVRRYQAMRGLEVDGVVGSATWRETGL